MAERWAAKPEGSVLGSEALAGPSIRGGDGWRGSDFERDLNVINMVTDTDRGQAQPANPTPISLIPTLGKSELCNELGLYFRPQAQSVTSPHRHPASCPLGRLFQRTRPARTVPGPSSLNSGAGGRTGCTWVGVLSRQK